MTGSLDRAVAEDIGAAGRAMAWLAAAAASTVAKAVAGGDAGGDGIARAALARGAGVIDGALPGLGGPPPRNAADAVGIIAKAVAGAAASGVMLPTEIADALVDGHAAAADIATLLGPDPEPSRAEEVARRALSKVALAKADEQRYVLCVVLEPQEGATTDDSQGDTYTADEIEKAQQWYAENSDGGTRVMHGKPADAARVGLRPEIANDPNATRVLENYIVRCDDPTTTINGQVIRRGTWMIALRIVDDELWAKVKSGEITGVSIGGSAVRTPVA